jgi:hypothetical protein
MPKFLVVETMRYEVTAETIEDARGIFNGIVNNTQALTDTEFANLVEAVELLDGTTTFEEQ